MRLSDLLKVILLMSAKIGPELVSCSPGSLLLYWSGHGIPGMHQGTLHGASGNLPSGSTGNYLCDFEQDVTSLGLGFLLGQVRG